MSMHRSARHDPRAGQVNLEKPLPEMIKEYQASVVEELRAENAFLLDQIASQASVLTSLRGRVHELEKRLLEAYYDGRNDAQKYDY